MGGVNPILDSEIHFSKTIILKLCYQRFWISPLRCQTDFHGDVCRESCLRLYQRQQIIIKLRYIEFVEVYHEKARDILMDECYGRRT